MISLDNLEHIARYSVGGAHGCGSVYLASLQESWAPFRRFLHNVVAATKPGAVLECGVHKGITTAHMAYANPHTLVIGIDRDYHLDACEITGHYDNIILLDGDTTDCFTFDRVEELLSGFFLSPYGSIGLLFLDSTHDGDTPRKEFELYEPLLADGCIVAVDDLLGPEHLMKRMQEFWNWLPCDKREMHFLHPVPETHIGLIDQPGFGVGVHTKT